MTTKLLVIESCACCKFAGTNWAEGKIDGTRCLKATRKIETNIRTTIPPWCPLPDAGPLIAGNKAGSRIPDLSDFPEVGK